MNEKMSNAPVYYALTKVQFNPITKMADFVSGIQDILRLKGYTRFEPQEITQLQLLVDKPQVTQMKNWLMTKPDQSAGFVLNESSLSYHTTHYDTHKTFFPELLSGLEAVHQIVSLEHLSRLGLRYLDAVLPEENVTVDQYLAPGLHGIPFNVVPRFSLVESVFETTTGPLLTKGTLVVRAFRTTGPLGYPHDLVPHGLVPMERFDIKRNVSHAVIDIDHFAEGQVPIDIKQLQAQLLSLHKGMKAAFEATFTPYAKAIWK